jgi:E3 ubiquitin-protein ligase RNF14
VAPSTPLQVQSFSSQSEAELIEKVMSLVEDWQQQKDELQALKAIFEDDFEILAFREWGSGSRAAAAKPLVCQDAESIAALPCPSAPWEFECQLTMQVTLPAGRLLVSVKGSCDQDGGGERKGEGEGEGGEPGAAGGFAVSHLPPISLHLLLPAGYPSTEAPTAKLSARWLDTGRADALVAELARVWEDQGAGAPVIYSWYDWLQTGSLEALGCADTLRLAKGVAVQGERASEAPGETEEQETEEVVLLSLLRYDAVQNLEEFLRSEHICGICMDSLPGTAFERLDCGHRCFCRDCLSQQAAINLAEGTLDLLRCPEPKCGAPFPPHKLRALLPPEGFDRWEQITLMRALDSMPDAAYCPRCKGLCLEDADGCADCPTCLFVFCTLCNEGWHPGVLCVSAETRLAMLRKKAEGGGARSIEQLRRKEQELLSLAQIDKTAKRCPRCGMAIEKEFGCNKMHCAACSTYFCWRCGKDISVVQYKHFQEGGTHCILFDEQEILRWERQFGEMAARHQQVELDRARNEFIGLGLVGMGGGGGGFRRARPCLCPNCGQGNFRIAGNNHICCWSCTRHFCALCRVVLQRKGGMHFGAGGCRQHSVD